VPLPEVEIWLNGLVGTEPDEIYPADCTVHAVIAPAATLVTSMTRLLPKLTVSPIAKPAPPAEIVGAPCTCKTAMAVAAIVGDPPKDTVGTVV